MIENRATNCFKSEWTLICKEYIRKICYSSIKNARACVLKISEKRKSNSPVAAVVAAVGKPIDLYFLASHEEQTLQQPHSSWTWFKYSIRPMIYHYIWRMTMNIKWLKSIHFESSVLHDLQFAQFYDTENREEHCFKSEWTLIYKKIPYFLI